MSTPKPTQQLAEEMARKCADVASCGMDCFDTSAGCEFHSLLAANHLLKEIPLRELLEVARAAMVNHPNFAYESYSEECGLCQALTNLKAKLPEL